MQSNQQRILAATIHLTLKPAKALKAPDLLEQAAVSTHSLSLSYITKDANRWVIVTLI